MNHSTITNAVFLASSMFTLAACSVTAPSIETLSNKDKAVALVASIENGDPAPVAYINPIHYTQHNLAIADGLAGFGAVMQQLPKGSAKATVKRAFQDGEYVVTHTQYNFFGPKAGFDVFRFKDGQIVEHWDNLQTVSPVNASGRSQFDGPTTLTDLDKTAQNKAIVNEFVHTIFLNGEMTKINQFIGPKTEDYVQHNPYVSDGLSGLGAALTELAKQGMPMVYQQNHKILGEGNFVLAISEGEFMKQHVAFYDLFRLDSGMIVEHWDTIEAIPAAEDRKNSNGKFGFQ